MCCSTTVGGPTIVIDNVEEDGALIDKGDKGQKDLFRSEIIKFNTCIIKCCVAKIKDMI